MTSKFAKNRLRPILMKLGMMLEVDETFIHDNMTFKVIRGQGQGQEMTSVPFRDYFLQQQQQLFYCHYTGQKVCRRILLEQSYTYGN